MKFNRTAAIKQYNEAIEECELEMDENPKIGVVISCYNHQRFVKECLDSICRQTYDNFFINIFDNNSTDNSRIVIKDYIRDNTTNKKIILDTPLFTTGTVPIGVARWLMVKRVINDCDWVAIVDADDFWDDRKLEYQVNAIREYPEAALCFSDCFYYYWEDKVKQVFNYPAFYKDAEGRVGKRTFNDKYSVPKKRKDYFKDLITRYNFMPCPTLMFKSSVWKELIKNPTHYTSAQDFDWNLRFTMNHPAVWVKNPLAYYRMHKDQTSQLTTAFCTAEEIDAVKRISAIMPTERYKRLKTRIKRHLFWLYCKLIYKEIKNG